MNFSLKAHFWLVRTSESETLTAIKGAISVDLAPCGAITVYHFDWMVSRGKLLLTFFILEQQRGLTAHALQTIYSSPFLYFWGILGL